MLVLKNESSQSAPKGDGFLVPILSRPGVEKIRQRRKLGARLKTLLSGRIVLNRRLLFRFLTHPIRPAITNNVPPSMSQCGSCQSVPVTLSTYFFALSPSSTRRRMAPGRDRPGSFCFVIQLSRASRCWSCILTSTPVLGPVACLARHPQIRLQTTRAWRLPVSLPTAVSLTGWRAEP
jgi:hypothetical protein